MQKEIKLKVKNQNPNKTYKNNYLVNIRKSIRLLQIFPLILSLIIDCVYILDILDINLYSIVCPLFGSSIFIILFLYLIAKNLRVSIWSRLSYICLIIMHILFIIDNLFLLDQSVITLYMLSVITLSISNITSLLTFINVKFKYNV